MKIVIIRNEFTELLLGKHVVKRSKRLSGYIANGLFVHAKECVMYGEKIELTNKNCTSNMQVEIDGVKGVIASIGFTYFIWYNTPKKNGIFTWKDLQFNNCDRISFNKKAKIYDVLS